MSISQIDHQERETDKVPEFFNTARNFFLKKAGEITDLDGDNKNDWFFTHASLKQLNSEWKDIINKITEIMLKQNNVLLKLAKEKLNRKPKHFAISIVNP
ncbi:MAG: hypothetical protein V4490_02390, partial [Pseudomonadota bacterium]